MENNTNFIVRAEVDFNQVDYLDKSDFNNSKYAIGIGFKANNTIIVTDDGSEYSIKKDTRAIHFDGMLDSEKEKVFASLSKNLTGGDCFKYIDVDFTTVSVVAYSQKYNAVGLFDSNINLLEDWLEVVDFSQYERVGIK